MAVVAIVQFILHFLGWGGIVLGVIALIVGNTDRGTQLVISGISFIALKYVIGFLFVMILGRKDRG